MPTASESGLPGYNVTSWYGVFTPPGTPAAIIGRLNSEIGAVLKAPDVTERLSAMGAQAAPTTPEEFGRIVRDAQRFTNIYELIPQTFVMPVADFASAAPAFDPRQIALIRLVFDKTEAGTVVVQHVGVSNPADPAFLAAPVPAPIGR